MRSPVAKCAEWHRIDALPRRKVVLDRAFTERMSDMLRIPGAVDERGGKPMLFDVQATALAEVIQSGGYVGMLQPGEGKSLISYLAPTVRGKRNPCLLVPARLREAGIRNYLAAARAWRVHPNLTIDSYEMQTAARNATRLADRRHDMIILDEAQRAKDPNRTVARRIQRLFDGPPETWPEILILSGTLIDSQIADAAHLAAWALHLRSPFPREYHPITTWDSILDIREDGDTDVGGDAGALRHWAEGSTIIRDLRDGVRARITDTPGVMVSPPGALAVNLHTLAWRPPKPHGRQDMLDTLEKTGQLPDGRDLEAPPQIAACMQTIACGFWDRWKVTPPNRWKHVRRLWARFVRQTIKGGTYDSPEHVAGAIRSGALDEPTCAELADEIDQPEPWDIPPHDPVLQAWCETKPTFEPELETVWIGYETVDAMAEWAHTEQGIVWVRRRALGVELDKRGVPYFASHGRYAGADVKRRLQFVEDTPKGPIAASVKACSEGLNLQYKWSTNLHTAIPSGRHASSELEQTIARTHRRHQVEDTVYLARFETYAFQRAAWENALRGAEYHRAIYGNPQRLSRATHED